MSTTTSRDVFAAANAAAAAAINQVLAALTPHLDGIDVFPSVPDRGFASLSLLDQHGDSITVVADAETGHMQVLAETDYHKWIVGNVVAGDVDGAAALVRTALTAPVSV